MMDYQELDRYLRGYFRKQGLQEADIDDVVQTALLRAHQASYDASRGSYRTWALTIAKNCWVDRCRKRKADTSAFEEDIGIIPQSEDDAEDVGYRLRLVLARLPAKHRDLIERKFIAGIPTAQLAEERGVAPGTIRWHLHQARNEFRKLWDKYQETVACQCGCGNRLPKYTSRGAIRRFARGHSRRLSARQRRQKLVLCACGCGEWRPVVGKNGKTARYIEGHYNKENRKYTGQTRAKRMSQSAMAKRQERKALAEAKGINPERIITKVCSHCGESKQTRWTGNYNADLTPIYHSRCIECKKEYARERRKAKKARS